MSKKPRVPTHPAKENQTPNMQMRQMVAQQHWSGPLPPPEQLARFEDVLPGTAARIIAMAEKEGEHSREVQMRAVRATVRLQHIGQVMAFVLSCCALTSAYWLAMAGHDWVAGSLVAGGFVGLATVFLRQPKQ